MSPATTPSRIEGRWTVDVDRERPVLQTYFWSLRPSLFRWQFMATLAVVALLDVILILVTGSQIGWALVWVLAALLLLVITLRLVLRRALRNGFLSSALSGTVVDVEMDAAGWRSSSTGTVTAYPWDSFDRSAVREGHVILTIARRGSWLPRSVVYAPLTAFGADAGHVPDFVARAIAGAE